MAAVLMVAWRGQGQPHCCAAAVHPMRASDLQLYLWVPDNFELDSVLSVVAKSLLV